MFANNCRLLADKRREIASKRPVMSNKCRVMTDKRHAIADKRGIMTNYRRLLANERRVLFNNRRGLNNKGRLSVNERRKLNNKARGFANRTAFYLRVVTKTVQFCAMKFYLAILIYLLIGLILGGGILLVMAGKPLFLILAFIVYVVAFGKLGCMTH